MIKPRRSRSFLLSLQLCAAQLCLLFVSNCAFSFSPSLKSRRSVTCTSNRARGAHPESLRRAPSFTEARRGESQRGPRERSFIILQASAFDDGDGDIYMEAVASAGLSPSELAAILSAVSSGCAENGLFFSRTGDVRSTPTPAVPVSVPGAIGRVLLLGLNGVSNDFDVDNDETLMPDLRASIAEQVDRLLFEATSDEDDDEGSLDGPVLVSVQANIDPLKLTNEMEKGLSVGGMGGSLFTKIRLEQEFERSLLTLMASIVKKEVERRNLRKALLPTQKNGRDTSFSPSVHVEIDGATVQDIATSESLWDTSTVLVFDDMVDDGLRGRLLDVVLGRDKKSAATNNWDDEVDGPDPRRWVRGGLIDIPRDDEEGLATDEENGYGDGSCWGLRDEAIFDLCSNDHPALSEFESKLTDLFSDFIVSRLPEAVLGASVSPLTANAPTYGDDFDYHIDCDPNLAPPSPWTDVYGRYPNRAAGKPRFVSCLVYLNDKWDGPTWGAPTRFLDPPTKEVFDVLPQPGRCVIMDQDVMHTVVAPNEAAGLRPRYSLVWKLILHPKRIERDVSDLSGSMKSRWPQVTYVGSASPDFKYRTYGLI